MRRVQRRLETSRGETGEREEQRGGVEIKGDDRRQDETEED